MLTGLVFYVLLFSRLRCLLLLSFTRHPLFSFFFICKPPRGHEYNNNKKTSWRTCLLYLSAETGGKTLRRHFRFREVMLRARQSVLGLHFDGKPPGGLTEAQPVTILSLATLLLRVYIDDAGAKETHGRPAQSGLSWSKSSNNSGTIQAYPWTLSLQTASTNIARQNSAALCKRMVDSR